VKAFAMLADTPILVSGKAMARPSEINEIQINSIKGENDAFNKIVQ
jgi:hypothetical protein